MKAISASIVVLAAVLLIIGGANVAHGDTSTVIQLAGYIVLIFGLGGWRHAMLTPPS